MLVIYSLIKRDTNLYLIFICLNKNMDDSSSVPPSQGESDS